MKRIGLISHLLPFLIILVCFSVGFSSWILPMPEAPTSANGGSISASPVYYSSDYINPKNGADSISVFNYTTLYFLDGEGNPSDKGYITVEYEVDLANLKEALGDSWANSATMRFTLSASNIIAPDDPENFSLFSDFSVDGTGTNRVSASITGMSSSSVTVSNATLLNTSGILTYTCKISGLADSGTLTFTVVYELTVPQGANFRESFGQYIKNFDNDKTEFVTTAVAIGS